MLIGKTTRYLSGLFLFISLQATYTIPKDTDIAITEKPVKAYTSESIECTNNAIAKPSIINVMTRLITFIIFI